MYTATDLQHRSIYGKRKRFKRGLLRAVGRWSRCHYDVQVIMENDRPAYKKIIFASSAQAECTIAVLARFGATPHLPTWRRCDDNAIWVDYIEGAPCDRIDDDLMPELSACFGAFATRNSRRTPIERTNYWRRHLVNLRYLRSHGVIDAGLHDDLCRQSTQVRPNTLRVGFDYGDPIGPNLLHREDDGRVCAIDVKNLRSHTLVGVGLAKATDRWLCPARQRFMFDHLKRLGLGDIEQAFGFITCYERVARVRRKVQRDLRVRGRIKEPDAKSVQLLQLLD